MPVSASNVMTRYFRIYRTLLKMNFSVLVAYRTNFMNNIVSSLSWGIFSLLSVYILTFNSRSVFGWSRDELLLLNGLYGIVIGVFHTAFTRNFERFANIIHFGRLDGILLKPLDPLFLLTFWLFNYAGISRIMIAAVFSWYFATRIGLSLTILQIAGFTLYMFMGILLLYSVWCNVLTFTIWKTRLTNLVDLMFSLTGTARFPREMYRCTSEYVYLFLFPFTLIVNVPARIYLGKAGLSDQVILCAVSLVSLIAARKFWKYALRSYTSASG